MKRRLSCLPEAESRPSPQHAAISLAPLAALGVTIRRARSRARRRCRSAAARTHAHDRRPATHQQAQQSIDAARLAVPPRKRSPERGREPDDHSSARVPSLRQPRPARSASFAGGPPAPGHQLPDERQGSGGRFRLGRQPSVNQTRRITKVPLVPPNPNEFFKATSIRMGRAWLAQ